MQRITQRAIPVLALWLTMFLIIGCGSIIASYSERAYQQTTSLKVEALSLMDKATESYSLHKGEVEAFLIEIEKAYEYAKGRPKNGISAKQWEILKDPNGHLLGGFFKRWKDQDILGPTFINEAKQGLIVLAFDLISGLERGKNKPGEAKIIGE
jgi:hypothetical protein